MAFFLAQRTQNFGLFWPILANFDYSVANLRFLVCFLQALVMWRCTKIDKYQVCPHNSPPHYKQVSIILNAKLEIKLFDFLNIIQVTCTCMCGISLHTYLNVIHRAYLLVMKTNISPGNMHSSTFFDIKTTFDSKLKHPRGWLQVTKVNLKNWERDLSVVLRFNPSNLSVNCV